MHTTRFWNNLHWVRWKSKDYILEIHNYSTRYVPSKDKATYSRRFVIHLLLFNCWTPIEQYLGYNINTNKYHQYLGYNINTNKYHQYLGYNINTNKYHQYLGYNINTNKYHQYLGYNINTNKYHNKRQYNGFMSNQNKDIMDRIG